MKEEITEQKLGAVLWDIVESFKPNDEDCPYSFLDITKNLKRTELIDLTQLPPNSFLYVHGSHTRASYWLLRLNEEKGQRVVDVWRDLDTNGLRAPIDKIISVEIKGSDEKTLWIVERGIIRQGFNMAFPYFSYEDSPERGGKKSVILPETYWMDSYRSIFRVDRQFISRA